VARQCGQCPFLWLLGLTRSLQLSSETTCAAPANALGVVRARKKQRLRIMCNAIACATTYAARRMAILLFQHATVSQGVQAGKHGICGYHRTAQRFPLPASEAQIVVTCSHSFSVRARALARQISALACSLSACRDTHGSGDRLRTARQRRLECLQAAPNWSTTTANTASCFGSVRERGLIPSTIPPKSGF